MGKIEGGQIEGHGQGQVEARKTEGRLPTGKAVSQQPGKISEARQQIKSESRRPTEKAAGQPRAFSRPEQAEPGVRDRLKAAAARLGMSAPHLGREARHALQDMQKRGVLSERLLDYLARRGKLEGADAGKEIAALGRGDPAVIQALFGRSPASFALAQELRWLRCDGAPKDAPDDVKQQIGVEQAVMETTHEVGRYLAHTKHKVASGDRFTGLGSMGLLDPGTIGTLRKNLTAERDLVGLADLMILKARVDRQMHPDSAQDTDAKLAKAIASLGLKGFDGKPVSTQKDAEQLIATRVRSQDDIAGTVRSIRSFAAALARNSAGQNVMVGGVMSQEANRAVRLMVGISSNYREGIWSLVSRHGNFDEVTRSKGLAAPVAERLSQIKGDAAGELRLGNNRVREMQAEVARLRVELQGAADPKSAAEALRKAEKKLTERINTVSEAVENTIGKAAAKGLRDVARLAALQIFEEKGFPAEFDPASHQSEIRERTAHLLGLDPGNAGHARRLGRMEFEFARTLREPFGADVLRGWEKETRLTPQSVGERAHVYFEQGPEGMMSFANERVLQDMLDKLEPGARLDARFGYNGKIMFSVTPPTGGLLSAGGEVSGATHNGFSMELNDKGHYVISVGGGYEGGLGANVSAAFGIAKGSLSGSVDGQKGVKLEIALRDAAFDFLGAITSGMPKKQTVAAMLMGGVVITQNRELGIKGRGEASIGLPEASTVLKKATGSELAGRIGALVDELNPVSVGVSANASGEYRSIRLKNRDESASLSQRTYELAAEGHAALKPPVVDTDRLQKEWKKEAAIKVTHITGTIADRWGLVTGDTYMSTARVMRTSGSTRDLLTVLPEPYASAYRARDAGGLAGKLGLRSDEDTLGKLRSWFSGLDDLVKKSAMGDQVEAVRNLKPDALEKVRLLQSQAQQPGKGSGEMKKLNDEAEKLLADPLNYRLSSVVVTKPDAGGRERHAGAEMSKSKVEALKELASYTPKDEAPSLEETGWGIGISFSEHASGSLSTVVGKAAFPF